MNYKEARNAIMSRFLTELSGVTVFFDNQQASPPAPGTNVKWVHLMIKFTQARQDSFGSVGNRKYVRQGLLIAQVFTPIDTATDTNDELCQQIIDTYEGVRLTDIWFFDGGITYSGNDGVWYQQNVSFDIHFEEMK
jgi:hypothetical protein